MKPVAVLFWGTKADEALFRAQKGPLTCVEPRGLEPLTPCLQSRRNRLSKTDLSVKAQVRGRLQWTGSAILSPMGPPRPTCQAGGRGSLGLSGEVPPDR